MKQLSCILLKIFAIGIVVCLFAGGLSGLGYVIALIAGGDTAANICDFVFKVYLPWIIKCTSVFTGIGLLGMYLSKQRALTVQTEAVKNAEAKERV